MLILDCLLSTSFPNRLFLIAYLRDQIRQKAHVRFKARGSWVHAALNDRGTRRCAGFDAIYHEIGSEDAYGISVEQSRAIRLAVSRLSAMNIQRESMFLSLQGSGASEKN